MTINVSPRVAAIGAVAVVIAIGLTYFDAREAKQSAATSKAFIEEMVFADAVRACALVEGAIRFQYREAKQKAIIGLRSSRNPYNGRPMPYFRLYADGQVCDYYVSNKRADVGMDEDEFWGMFGRD